MSDIIFKGVSPTKRAPAWKFFHYNEDKKLEESSRSVFRFRNSRKDLDETISADPAIKKRGPAQDFNDTFIGDSDIH